MNQRSNLASIIMYASLSLPFLSGCQTLQRSIQTRDNKEGYIVVEPYCQELDRDDVGVSAGIDVTRLWDYMHEKEKKRKTASETVRTQTSYPFLR